MQFQFVSHLEFNNILELSKLRFKLKRGIAISKWHFCLSWLLMFVAIKRNIDRLSRIITIFNNKAVSIFAVLFLDKSFHTYHFNVITVKHSLTTFYSAMKRIFDSPVTLFYQIQKLFFKTSFPYL